MSPRPDPVEPEEGQESVWDYPRPPKLERVNRRLRVIHAGEVIAETERGWRVLETSHPPNYYFPPEDVEFEYLEPSASQGTLCEWKGEARYWDLAVEDEIVERVAWSYPSPVEEFAALESAVAFYAGRVDEAWVGEERAQPQPGEFYGGWITWEIVGPFKGESGSVGW